MVTHLGRTIRTVGQGRVGTPTAHLLRPSNQLVTLREDGRDGRDGREKDGRPTQAVNQLVTPLRTGRPADLGEVALPEQASWSRGTIG